MEEGLTRKTGNVASVKIGTTREIENISKNIIMFQFYHRWNLFERKFFWLNNIAIALLMIGSVITSSFNFIETPQKLGIITTFIIAYAWYRKSLWNKLESLEREWKDEKQMSILW